MKLGASEAETSSPSPEGLSTWEMASMNAKQCSSGTQGDGEKIRVNQRRLPGGGEFQEF